MTGITLVTLTRECRLASSTIMVSLLFVLGTLELLAQTPDTIWNHDIEVTTGEVEFAKVLYPAYSVMAYETSQSALQSLIKDELTAASEGKAKGKGLLGGGMVSHEEFAIPGFTEHNFMAIATAEDMKSASGAVKASFAFIHDSVPLTEESNAAAHEEAMAFVRDLGVKMNKSIVTGQIENAQKELESLTRKRDAVVKQKENLESSISKSESKIRKLTADSIKYANDKLAQEAEVASMEKLASGSTADAKTVKKLGKAKSKLQSTEQKVMKTDQNKIKEQSSISQAQAEIPVKENEIKNYEEQMAAQERLIAALKKKFEAIQ